MTDTVDDLFDFEQLVQERAEDDTQHATYQIEERAVDEEKNSAMTVVDNHVILYVDNVMEWLTRQIDELLAKVENERDVGMLRGFGMVKAKLQADRLNAKGVLGNG